MKPFDRFFPVALNGLFLLGVLSADRAQADLEPLPPPRAGAGRFTLGANVADDSQVYTLDARIPLWRTERARLFLNPRGVFIEDVEQEGNLGLILRRAMADRPVILGANVFGDIRRSAENNTFYQVGGGLELLSRWVDARANYYIPLTDPKILRDDEEAHVSVSGGIRTTTIRQYRDIAEALQGFDAEMGLWLPGLSRVLPTALYVGYVDFESDAGADNLSGVKARIESRPHPNLTFDAAWFEKTAYAGADFFVGLRLHLPLGFRRGIRLTGDGAAGGRIPLFASRLSDPVQRDFRVRMMRTDAVLVGSRTDRHAVSSPRQRVCYDVVTLDDEGNVIIVRICE